MHLRTAAIVCSSRSHGETAAIVRMLSADHGLLAGYVAGGRGRQLRPILVPGNLVEAELHWRSESQLPTARLELTHSRGPWLGEPLAAAAIGWVTALTTAALPTQLGFAWAKRSRSANTSPMSPCCQLWPSNCTVCWPR